MKVLNRKFEVWLLGAVCALLLTFFVGTIQSHAVTYLHSVSDIENFISTNGGTYELIHDNTIRLTSDFASENPMYIYLNSSDVTLDLNDHTMQFQCSNGIVAYGADYTFYIMNSGTSKSKAVICTTGTYLSKVDVSTLTVSTKMTISGVTIRNDAVKNSGNPYAIEQTVKGSVLTMTDCVVESTGSCYYMIYGESEFHNCNMSAGGDYPTILLENQGNIVIDGGTYEHTGNQAVVCVQTEAIEGDATLSILGGTFQGKNHALTISGARAIVSISQGTFSISNTSGEPVQVLDGNNSLTYNYDESIYTMVKTDNTLKIVTKEEIEKVIGKEIDPNKDKIYNIKKARPVISKLTAGKKKFTVKMAKKVSSYYGKKFQIAYRVKGQSKWKYATTSAKSRTVSSLKSGKKYQVKVRSYITIGGKKYYSKWSKVKNTAKIKK